MVSGSNLTPNKSSLTLLGGKNQCNGKPVVEEHESERVSSKCQNLVTALLV